jgi:Fe-Mn family superoxide dismutase
MHSESVGGMSRREALKTLGTGAALLGLSGLSRTMAADLPSQSVTPPSGGQPFALPKLAYAYDALEPHIDRQTMEIHHTKHHQAYITNANQALASHSELKNKSAIELLKALDSVPEKIRVAVRNNVGGHVNHTLLWETMSPQGGGQPSGELASLIVEAFGSFDVLKTQFADAAMKRFGSGWAWLSLQGKALKVHSTANQDSPLSEGAVPLLGVDVWEHAYYLKYQNRRADYLAAFWNVVNWGQVAKNYQAAKTA